MRPCKPFAHSWSTARFSCICRAPLWADARCKFGQKGKIDCLKGLRKVLFSKPAQLVFEMKIVESTDDKLSIDFHYCPLVKAWQNAGCTDEEIAKLCDIAILRCAATTASGKTTAVCWICRNALPRAMTFAHCGIIKWSRDLKRRIK